MVYNTNDSGAGSLRQAVVDNATLGSDNTIIFSNVVTGAIALTSGELFISNDVTILGPGTDLLAVSGNNASRVFNITNGVVNISGLAICNGNVTGAAGTPGQSVSGGGILCQQQATVALTGCVVSNCAATGGGGSVGIGVGSYGGNGGNAYGGGICNLGGLTLNQCWVVGNQAAGGSGGFGLGHGGNGGLAEGGGIYSSSSADVTIQACTLSANSAIFGGHGGGGGGNGTNGTAYGAGLFHYTGPLSLINSTVASNVVNGAGTGSYGGIWSGSGPPVSLAGCTVVGNNGDSSGGGVAGVINGPVTDTIIAGNSASSSPDVGGAFTSGGYNLIGNTSGSTGFGAVGDQLNVNPFLGPLQDNGGPTLTMLPATNSPAIDKGENAAGLLTDQHGRCRIYDNPAIPNANGGDGSDIGAVELNPPHTTIVTTNIDGFGAATLRYCICDAQPMDTITFAPGVSGVVTLYNVFGGELLINKSLAIVGPGAKVLAVSAATTNRVFDIADAGTVSISGLTISNGVAGNSRSGALGAGGGIYNNSSALTVSNCVISGNYGGFGGGIYNDGDARNATLTVVACTLSGNSASDSGGGIYNDGDGGSATATVIASTFSENYAYSGSANPGGGGIGNYDGYGSATLTVVASTFSGNVVLGSGYGSGILIVNAVGTAILEIGDTIVQAGASGATLVNFGGTVTSDGYNLSSDGANGYLAGTGDQVFTDPMLGPLADNGGPTPTMALLAGSPAIDKGKSFGLMTDQRGAPRPNDFSSIANASGGDGSDIGAFELGTPHLNIQQVGANAVLSWPSYYGDFSLQSSINLASSNSWIAAGGSAAVVGSQYQQTNSPILGSKFFRLKSN